MISFMCLWLWLRRERRNDEAKKTGILLVEKRLSTGREAFAEVLPGTLRHSTYLQFRSNYPSLEGIAPKNSFKQIVGKEGPRHALCPTKPRLFAKDADASAAGVGV